MFHKSFVMTAMEKTGIRSYIKANFKHKAMFPVWVGMCAAIGRALRTQDFLMDFISEHPRATGTQDAGLPYGLYIGTSKSNWQSNVLSARPMAAHIPTHTGNNIAFEMKLICANLRKSVDKKLLLDCRVMPHLGHCRQV